jgi:hypothetical protein
MTFAIKILHHDMQIIERTYLPLKNLRSEIELQSGPVPEVGHD